MTETVKQQFVLDQYYNAPDQLINLLPIPAIIVLRSGRIAYVNKRFADLYLTTVADMLGRRMQNFSEIAGRNLQEYFELLEQGKNIPIQEVFIYGRYYQVLIQAIYNNQNQVEAVYILKWNISKIKRQQQTVYYHNQKYKEEIYIDKITDIANDFAFEQYFLKLKIDYPNEKILFLFIDLDYFEDFNNQYGFQIANKTLYDIAQSLKNELKSEDYFFAKLNSDHFVVVLPEVRKSTGYIIAERLRYCIYKLKIEHKINPDHYLTISSILHRSDLQNIQNTHQLIWLLENQLYQYKQEDGRNHCFVF